MRICSLGVKMRSEYRVVLLPLVQLRSLIGRLHHSAADGGEGHPFTPCAVTPFLTLPLTLLFLHKVTPDCLHGSARSPETSQWTFRVQKDAA